MEDFAVSEGLLLTTCWTRYEIAAGSFNQEDTLNVVIGKSVRSLFEASSELRIFYDFDTSPDTA